MSVQIKIICGNPNVIKSITANRKLIDDKFDLLELADDYTRVFMEGWGDYPVEELSKKFKDSAIYYHVSLENELFCTIYVYQYLNGKEKHITDIPNPLYNGNIKKVIGDEGVRYLFDASESEISHVYQKKGGTLKKEIAYKDWVIHASIGYGQVHFDVYDKSGGVLAKAGHGHLLTPKS